MIEKYIKNTITRTDLEDWILKHSLENEYSKPYTQENFKINGNTSLQIIDETAYYALKKELSRLNNLAN